MPSIEAQPDIHTVQLGDAPIRLMLADGGERCDYLQMANVIERLGGVHSGINLMAEFYPDRCDWPSRTEFGPDVPHYRRWYKDETDKTKLLRPQDGSDGYYAMDITNADNEVMQQVKDSRSHGFDVRITLTADITTSDDDLRKIAEMLKDFGPIEIRLNHEANANTWFRFAQNVGLLPPGEKRNQLYAAISNFFIRAEKVMHEVAPNIKLIACYNGPAEEVNAKRLPPGKYPNLTKEELGPMYLLPGIGISIDQYGSLHYGCPGHKILRVPVIGPVTHAEHRSFALPPKVLFEDIIFPFQRFMSGPDMRGERVKIDLGEMNYDQEIHGPDITADRLNECYQRISEAPDAIGSVVFYGVTDRWGLGLFQQQKYGDLEHLTENIVTDTYRNIMQWPVFQHPTSGLYIPVGGDIHKFDLEWHSSGNAKGLEIPVNQSVNALDLGESYWHRAVLIDDNGKKQYLHTDNQVLEVPPGTKTVQIYALPKDGKNNRPDGYYKEVPEPQLRRSAVVFEADKA